MQPGAFDDDVDAAGHLIAFHHLDVLALEVKKAQEFDEVALDEAQRGQIRELLLAHRERAQMVDLGLNVRHIGTQINALGAAPEAVAHVGVGELMQHALHHRELIKVGVKQRFDDHGQTVLRAS